MRNVLTFKLFLCSRQMVYGGAGCMLLVLTQSGLTNGQSDRMLLQATWIRFCGMSGSAWTCTTQLRT